MKLLSELMDFFTFAQQFCRYLETVSFGKMNRNGGGLSQLIWIFFNEDDELMLGQPVRENTHILNVIVNNYNNSFNTSFCTNYNVRT